MTELKYNLPEDEIKVFCRRWQITEFAFFGSVLRDDFRPDSDLDVLVSFAPEASWSLLDQVKMQQELELILGRAVDLVSRRAIESSANWIRRQEILSTAQSFYVA
ncbi:MAG: nucleotidyltransferase family protein [Acidobacteriota bacterium]|nr:nucleotidyltransferase family protein [Acidobacteriota bacterium]